MAVRNNAFDEMDINEETKKKFYDNCIKLIENMDQEKIKDKDGSTVVRTFESGRFKNIRKDKKSRIVGGAVAVFAFASVATMLALGVNYLNKEYKNSVAGREESSETESIIDYGSLYHNYFTDEEFIAEMYDSVVDYRGDGVVYSKDIIDLCYDENGKLKNGYEEKEFTVLDENEKEKKVTLVGKDFVVISKEETKRNADKVTNDYLSSIDKNNIDKHRSVCEKYEKEFCSAGYVYYIQGDYLVRTKLDKDLSTVCESGAEKCASLSKMGSKVLGHKEDIISLEGENKGSYIETLNDFKYYENIGKEPYNYEKYGAYSFTDANSINTDCIILFDKKNRKFMERLEIYQYAYSVQEGKIVLYYVDNDYNLWRIRNVSVFDRNIVKSIKEKWTYEDFVDGSSDYIIPELATGVDSDYKAEKIAENVDVNPEFWSMYPSGEIKLMEKNDGFKKLIDDEHVIYNEGKE